MGSKSGSSILGVISAVAAIIAAPLTGGASIAMYAVSVAAAVGSALIQRNIAKKEMRSLTGGSLSDFSASSANNTSQAGFLVPREGQVYIPVAYGSCLLGGHRTYLGVRDRVLTDGTVKQNEYLDCVLSLCEGEIKSVDDIFLDNVSIYSSASEFLGDSSGNVAITSGANDSYVISFSGSVIALKFRNANELNTIDNYLSNIGTNSQFKIFLTGLTSQNTNTLFNYQSHSVSQATSGINSTIFITITQTLTSEQLGGSNSSFGAYRAEFKRLLVSGGTNVIDLNIGSDEQTAFSSLVSATANATNKWTTAHKLNGVASIYFRLDAGQRQVWKGFPYIQPLIKGKIIYDPRDQTHKYSNNPALVILDYLKGKTTNNVLIYGMGLSDDFIDLQSFIQSANDCDSLGYAFDGVVDNAIPTTENLQDMVLASCRGRLIDVGGIYKLSIDKQTASTFTFTKDILYGDLQIELASKDLRANKIIAKFFNKDKNRLEDSVIISSPTYLARDGLLLEKNIELPYTIDKNIVKKIANIELNQSRKSITIQLTANFEAINVQCHDVVSLTYEDYGINAKKFRVSKMTLNPDKQSIDFILVEYDDDVYVADKLDVADSNIDFSVADLSVFPKTFIEPLNFAVVIGDSVTQEINFANSFDLGDILPVRLSRNNPATSIINSGINDILSLDDVLTSDVLLNNNINHGMSLKFFMQTSEDNSNYSDWVEFTSSAIVFTRYIKFKTVLTSSITDNINNPVISVSENLTVTANINY